VLLVVADTGPIRYLVEIGHIGILPRLFERVLIPSVVYDELCSPSAPAPVRDWVNALPAWLEVRPVVVGDDPAFRSLDDGEQSALTLGISSARRNAVCSTLPMRWRGSNALTSTTVRNCSMTS